MTRYTEVPTAKVRQWSAAVRQRFHEKVTPSETMIIDGKRCQVQRVVGGVWRDEPKSCNQSNANYPPATDENKEKQDE